MSRVLAQARAKYKKAILIELFFVAVLGSVIALLSDTQSAVDFCLGFSNQEALQPGSSFSIYARKRQD